jgi:hemolysin activation/secretion protein
VVTVRRFEVVGSTVFSAAELERVTARWTGKPIAFAQLLQVATAVTDRYLRAGYITSGAYIPVQKLAGGTVKIQVVEGRLEDIQIEIRRGRLSPEYVRDRLAIATAPPLNVNRLRQALQLLQLDPLVDRLQAELATGTQPGTNVLAVAVTGAKTFRTSLQLHNTRNPNVGTFERSVTLTEANLLGWGDGIDATYANTQGSNRFEGSYTLPVNPRNGTLRFHYQLTGSTIVEPPADDFDIDVDSRSFDLTFRQPLLRRATATGDRELALSVTAERRENDTQVGGFEFPLFEGADEEGKTRLTVLRLQQEWLQRSRRDVLALQSQFGLGLGAFGSTTNNDQPDGQFFAWRGQLLYSRLLGSTLPLLPVRPSLLLRSDLQLAADRLLPLEQFSLGGRETVRGYRQDALVTDSGGTVSAEVRWPVARVPEWQATLQLAPFVDLGMGWNVEADDPSPNALVGVGVGAIWQLGDRITARLDWGLPLVKVDGDDRTWQDNGLYFQVEWQPF